jgi:hypothetical protein
MPTTSGPAAEPREGQPAGQRDGDEPDEQPDRQAHAEGERVDLADLALGVAEQRGDVRQLAARRDHPHPVAELEHEAVVGEEVQVAATHAGDDAVEPAGHVQVAHRAPGRLGVGDEEAAEADGAAVVGEVLADLVAQPVAGLGHRLGGPDDDHPVPRQQLLVRGDDPGAVAAREVGQAHPLVGHAGDVPQPAAAVDLDADVHQAHAGHRVGVRARPPRPGQHRGDDEDRDRHAHRVGQGVADGGLVRAGQAGRGGEGRRRRHRPGEGARAQRGRQAQQGAAGDGRDGDDHEHHHRAAHERQLPAQVAKEPGPGRQPDRVDEQGEAQGLHQPQPLPQPRVEGADGQPDEEGAGRAEADGTEGHRAERGAEGDDDHHRQERGGRQHVEHDVSVSPPQASLPAAPRWDAPRPAASPQGWGDRGRPAGGALSPGGASRGR